MTRAKIILLGLVIIFLLTPARTEAKQLYKVDLPIILCSYPTALVTPPAPVTR